MLRSLSAPHLARSKGNVRVPAASVLSRRKALFWGSVVLWAIYLSFSASRAPLQSVSQRSRSLLEASSVKGRLDAIDFGKQPLQSLRAIVQRAISPVRPKSSAKCTKCSPNASSVVEKILRQQTKPEGLQCHSETKRSSVKLKDC